jgi:hypothetical protein
LGVSSCHLHARHSTCCPFCRLMLPATFTLSLSLFL